MAGTAASSGHRSPHRVWLMVAGGVAIALMVGVGLWLVNPGDSSEPAGAAHSPGSTASAGGTKPSNGRSEPPASAMPDLNADTVAKAIADSWEAELSRESGSVRRVHGARPAGGKFTAAINSPAGHPKQVSEVVCDIEQRPAISFDEPVYQDLIACLTPVLRGQDATAVPAWLHEKMSISPNQPAQATFVNLAIRVQYFSQTDIYVKVHSLPCDHCLG